MAEDWTEGDLEKLTVLLAENRASIDKLRVMIENMEILLASIAEIAPGRPNAQPTTSPGQKSE
jgi:hypothetical protein